MALRGSRRFRVGGDTLTIHFVDTSADLATLPVVRAGDSAFCVAVGGDDGRRFIARKSSAGIDWVEALTGAGDVTIAGDLVAADVRATGGLRLKDGGPVYLSLVAEAPTSLRTQTLPDRSGDVLVGPESAHSNLTPTVAGDLPGPTPAEITARLNLIESSYNGLLSKLRALRAIDT